MVIPLGQWLSINDCLTKLLRKLKFDSHIQYKPQSALGSAETACLCEGCKFLGEIGFTLIDEGF